MNTLYFLKFTVVILLLVAASIEDIKTKTIPNRLVLYGFAAGIILAFPYFTLPGVFDAFMGFMAGGSILLAVSCISRGGIGMGDVKLMACTGLYLGLGKTLGSLVISIFVCGIFGAALLFIKRLDRKTTVPFAPFILIGVVTVII